MKKSVAIFLLAVLLPSCVLGWLALRSAGEQQIILERRTAELFQSEVDNVATATRAIIDEQRRAFADAVRKLIAEEPPATLAQHFPAALARTWPREAAGFALATDGRILSPTAAQAATEPKWQQFLADNTTFLANKAPAVVYPVPLEDLAKPEPMRKKADYESAKLQSKAPAFAEERSAAASRSGAPAAAAPPPPKAVAKVEKEKLLPTETKQQALRNVAPQQQLETDKIGAVSQLSWSSAQFRELTASADEGFVTRFVQDRLNLIFWLRPPQANGFVFGCMIEASSLRSLLPAAFPGDRERSREFVLALLDEKAKPVVTDPSDIAPRDWKRPFVASEIGEALPHWEAALYLAKPEQLAQSAQTVRRTLLLLIAVALAAIACGGWLVVADARRQLRLAQQKTDFVSNVSHELKTPLTSIRMFAELMHGTRVDTSKHGQYSRIIMVEAERLTRLINNVLDFAKLERRQKRFDMRRIDLFEVIERAWQGQSLHFGESGFTARWQSAEGPYPVLGDDDALTQILVNLISNAEKYGGEKKEVELRSYLDGDSVFVSVLDRGAGVPPGEERKIFEPFYRAHDSLSSGIQGSGLGLTLAQRLAREHGGEITFTPRDGGGSNFTLRIPLSR